MAKDGNSSGTAPSHRGAAQISPADQQIQTVVEQLRSMRNDVVNFWLEYGPDKEFGGFHAVRAQQRQTTACPPIANSSSPSRLHPFAPNSIITLWLPPIPHHTFICILTPTRP